MRPKTCHNLSSRVLHRHDCIRLVYHSCRDNRDNVRLISHTICLTSLLQPVVVSISTARYTGRPYSITDSATCGARLAEWRSGRPMQRVASLYSQWRPTIIVPAWRRPATSHLLPCHMWDTLIKTESTYTGCGKNIPESFFGRFLSNRLELWSEILRTVYTRLFIIA